MRRVFPLPPAIQSVLDAKLQQTHSQQGQEMPHIPDPTPQPLTQSSRRVGCIAYKAGMTHEWDEHGVRVPLTVLWVDNCQVGARENEGMCNLRCGEKGSAALLS